MKPVVTPAFLANPAVLRWLNGVMPAWTMLDFGSYTVLHQEPLPGNEAIRLEPDLRGSDLVGSAVLRTARLLLQKSDREGGLKLTATGNLSRSVVAEMIDVIEWPDFDKAELVDLNKVINEPDFLPIYFVRMRLQAILFHLALWHVNLSYFARNPLDPWPQNHAGVVLWSLSATADDGCTGMN